MFLAGVPVRDELVLELARLVDDTELAGRLEEAYGNRVRVLALTIPERETLIDALLEAPPGLEELGAPCRRGPGAAAEAVGLRPLPTQD